MAPTEQIVAYIAATITPMNSIPRVSSREGNAIAAPVGESMAVVVRQVVLQCTQVRPVISIIVIWLRLLYDPGTV
jgi:hypothetical protein